LFNGTAYWLGISVRTNNAPSFTPLTPRQPLTSTPNALFANTASNLLGMLPAAQLSAGTANISISGNAATATTATTANSATSATTANTANNFSGSLSGDVTGTQGATAVANVGGQSAANVAGGASAANAATSANTANTIVERDSSGNFSAGTITLNGNLYLPTTTGTGGIIYSSGSSLVHAYGSMNFFAGAGAGNFTMSGSANTGIGMEALIDNTTGSYNTASGSLALSANTVGSDNTANGYIALWSNTNGTGNTAVGYRALRNNTSGSGNIALGSDAGGSLTTGSYNIDIGHSGNAGESSTIRIGATQTNTFIAGIYNTTASSGVAVYVTPSGQLGTLTSSARFKRDIHSMDDASDVLLSLRPVTFRYKPELDPQGLPQFGLVAEEVEKIDPDLVARDDKNQIYTVRYEAINAMLLNEFLKQHSKAEQQNTEIERLKEKAAKVDSLEKKLDELGGMVKSLSEKK